MLEEKQVISDEIDGDEAKMVPVSESIKYRKRAQSAEKQLAEVQEQLSQIEAEKQKLSGRLGEIEQQHQLTETLRNAGARDIESAMLLVRERLEKNKDTDITQIVNELKNEKQFLFDDVAAGNVIAGKTAGVRGKISSGANYLERQAKRAKQSGSKAEMMEYLKARRSAVRS